jgi:RNA polymerase sigma-70 factor (ECF subfamily)
MNQEQLRRDFVDVAYRTLLAFVGRLVGDRPTAEDITHDTFLAALGQPDFDPCRGVAAIKYLKTKARWLVQDHHRRSGRIRGSAADLADRGADLPEQAAEREETREQVRRGVAGLSEDHQEVVVRHLAGMGHEQIAADLKIPIKVVYRRFHAAKWALRRVLAGAR